MVLLFGITLGGLVAAIPVVLLTWSEHTVRTRDDISARVGVPIIAEVPLVKAGRGTTQEWVRSTTAAILSGVPAARPGKTGGSGAR
jgi:hypothetical protein